MTLVLPFGLRLSIGDIVSVASDGQIFVEGNTDTLLGRKATASAPSAKVDLQFQYGEGTNCTFRTAGTASTLFPSLPSARGGVDITFGTHDGWVMAFTGRSIVNVDQLDSYKQLILDAKSLNLWQPEWVLVTRVATVDKVTLVAARDNDTKVALDFRGSVAAGGPPLSSLTVDASVSAANKQFLNYIATEPTTAFFDGHRVRSRWWGGPTIGKLAIQEPRSKLDSEFWEPLSERR